MQKSIGISSSIFKPYHKPPHDLPIFSMRTTHILSSHMKETRRKQAVEISASNQNYNHRFVHPAARDVETSVEAEGMHRN